MGPRGSRRYLGRKKKLKNSTSIELYYASCPLGGVSISLSSAGVVHAINSLPGTSNCYGIPKQVIARAVSDLSEQELTWPYDALHKLMQLPRDDGFAHTLLRRDGTLIAIESSAEEYSLQKREAPFVHTNHFCNPKFDCRDVCNGTKSSWKRYEFASQHLGAACSGADLRSLTEDKSEGKSKSLRNRNTIASVVIDKNSNTASIWLKREKKKGWIDYPLDFAYENAEAETTA